MILIKNGNIHLRNGEILKNGDVLIEDKNIKQIGTKIVCDDATVIDASGMEVLPGFIIPITTVGLTDFSNFRNPDSNETTNPITPNLNVKYSLDKREVDLQQYYYSGITAFGASPGPNNIISGQMGVYNTWGKSIKSMCIKEIAGVKGNYTTDVKNAYGKKGIAPMTRMGIASMLRNALLEAREYENKDDKTYDDKNEILIKILSKEIPFVVNANTSTDIKSIIEIAKEFDIKLVIHNAYQIDQCEREILENKYTVLLGQLQSYGRVISYDTDFHKIIDMIKNGAIIGLSNGGDGMNGRECLLWSAIKMYQEGLDEEEVIKMITINNAIALGVDDIIGSIEENKQGDIVIYKGHPIKTYEARVEYSIIAGKIVYKSTGGFEKCYL